MCNFTLCDNGPAMTAKDLYDQDNLQFVSFFSCFKKKISFVAQPKHYGQRGENVLKVGTYAQKSK